MKRIQHLWLIGLGIAACIACMIGGLSKTPVHAQSPTSNDDGYFTVYTYIGYDGSNVYANSFVLEDPDDDLEVFSEEPEWELSNSSGSYHDSNGGDSFSSGPVPGGDTYTAVFTWSVEYEYDYPPFGDNGDDGCDLDCTGYDYPTGYASIDVPSPPPQISSISPSSVYQGDQGTLTITGSNLVEYAGDQLTINFSGPGMPFTLTGTPSSSTASFSYDFSGYPAGPYTLSVTNNEGTSNIVSFTVNSEATLDPCAITSNPHAGYSSIVSTGTTGGGGTMAVSFSGPDFSALTPSVPYGPYSTPSSIAAHMAALITKNYIQYGLSAKAYGPNIVYSGLTTLGTVTNVATGSSYTTNTSSSAATAAGIACYAAPPLPPGLSCKNVTRGGTTTCVANGGAVSNWGFTDGTNAVTRTTNQTSPTWSGVMATSGTVSVTVAGMRKTASITVSPRTGWAFTAASPTQQTNPYTPPANSTCPALSVNNTPVAPPAGSTATDANLAYALGLSGLCQASPYNYFEIGLGPNNGYTFITSGTNGAQFNWVGAQDILNPSSAFYGKQCGNYNPGTNVGFISGANLSLNLIRHESSGTQGQGHYGNYVASQNSASLNIGTAYESLFIFGDHFALATQVDAVTGPKKGAILAAAQVEPLEPQYNSSGTYLGDINYPPYAPPTATPTCP